MPLDPSIKKILLIGSGPIVIGQGCEFDYAGTQACKALKEEGCKVILLNSNPATIMTDSHIADTVYIEPITVEIVEKIIQQERPDSLLPIMGGQTALNCTRKLASQGILKKYGVNLIGLTLDTIEKSENRKLFKEEMLKIGIEVPKSFCAATWEEVLLAQRTLGFPLVVRCSFTLGGQGGGIAHNLEELENICKEAFSFSPELLIEQSISGWKEYELEVMRDRKGNCIVVCGIENVDPMGVHTGDSITVTPMQTLTDKEYQLMRKRAFQIIEALGMVSGGCNVQFAIYPNKLKNREFADAESPRFDSEKTSPLLEIGAVFSKSKMGLSAKAKTDSSTCLGINPETGRMLCIEVNPRVSRSSAFASKATGFPIAKIAAKLALGYNLDELKNETTLLSSFPSSFEPVIDYVAVKIPRFNFEKFQNINQHLSTHMKSVGEVMGLGSTFKEALNKAISSLDIQHIPHHQRLWFVFEALHNGVTVEEVHELTKFDPWFLEQINELVKEEKEIAKSLLTTVSFREMHRWKQMGFSDETLAELLKCTQKQINEKRKELKVHPVYKRIDTCSGEFPHEIAYMYSTYEEECESDPTTRKKVLVLGGGPNRIGQGIEFDYCCVHAVKAIRELAYESIIINCNPSTVSTDYDTTDRLYFEPLTIEHVREIIRIEKPLGTIIQFGGQTPLNIGKHLQEEGFALLGTPFASIDLAEDRNKFRIFAEKIGLKQPRNEVFSSLEEALHMATLIGFPMILRPSYVIGGNAIEIIQDDSELKAYVQDMKMASPVLMEEFLNDAMEVEVDAISDGKEVFICGIVEHVEPAGIHSGDSISFMSPYQLDKKSQDELIEQTRKIGQALKVVGLFNVQFAIHNNEIMVLEVNPRASRTIPLLSKTTGLPLVQIATRCILGQSLKEQGFGFKAEPKFLGLKLPVFPFSRLHIKNEKLGPQMKSTGEVLCTGKTFDELFMKARIYAAEHVRDVSLVRLDLLAGNGQDARLHLWSDHLDSGRCYS